MRRTPVTRLTLLIALLLSACAGPTTTQSEEDGPITLGVVWPFSNRTDQFREGIDMAVDEINAQGGLIVKQQRKPLEKTLPWPRSSAIITPTSRSPPR